eukprot:Opistho-2@39709
MANKKILSVLPAGLSFIGWFLLLVFTAKLSYDANHPTNNNEDNTAYLYTFSNAGDMWYLWAILFLQLGTAILAFVGKPIAASRLFIVVLVLMFQFFAVTAKSLKPCNSDPIKSTRKTACQYNSLGMAGAVISFVAAALGVFLIETEVSDKFN